MSTLDTSFVLSKTNASSLRFLTRLAIDSVLPKAVAKNVSATSSTVSA